MENKERENTAQLREYIKYLQDEVALRTRKLDKTTNDFKAMNEHLVKVATVVDHINMLSLAINKTQNIEDIFNAISDYARNLTSAEACLVMTVNEEGNLSIGGVAGICGQKQSANFLRSNNGYCRKIVEEGRPIRVNNINNGNGNVIGLCFEEFIIKDFMGVPFFSKEKTVGEIVVLNKKVSGGFTMQDHEMLITLGNQAANALENKTLIDAEKETQIIAMMKMAQLAEKRDPETGSHLERLKFYSKAIAEELRKFDDYKDVINDEFITSVFEASPLHDIGKVGIPDNILLKPGKLTTEEFDIMQQHAIIGGNILEGPSFLKIGRDIALWHHEKYDGTGYPGQLSGDKIPLCARIVALCDVYDAFTTNRVYKKAYSHKKAVKFVKEETGRHFDPDVARAFLNRTEEFEEIKEKNKN